MVEALEGKESCNVLATCPRTFNSSTSDTRVDEQMLLTLSSAGLLSIYRNIYARDTTTQHLYSNFKTLKVKNEVQDPSSGTRLVGQLCARIHKGAPGLKPDKKITLLCQAWKSTGPTVFYISSSTPCCLTSARCTRTLGTFTFT